jgi:hypothetical protein
MKGVRNLIPLCHRALLSACALEGIKGDTHHDCVHYYLPPMRPKDDAEEAERERNYQSCKQKVLSQHGL